MVGRAVLVLGPPHGGACCGGAWPPSWCGVLRWCVAPCMVGFSVVWWPMAPLIAGCAVVVRAPPHCGTCFVGACPLSSWGVLCWCAAPLMVGRPVLVLGPPHGGACCAGFWPPSWWAVLWWCLAFLMVGQFVSVPGLPPVGAGCVAWPPSSCGVLWWCVTRRMVVRAVLVGGPSPGGACFDGPWPPAWCGVLCWCAASLLLERVVSVRGPPAPWGPWWWCVACLMVERAAFVRLSVFVVVGLVAVALVSLLRRSGGPASRARAVRHPFVLAGMDGPAYRERAVGHPVLLFRGCRCSAARFPLFALRFLVSARLLAGCLRLSPLSCTPPPLGSCLAGVVVSSPFFPSPLLGCWLLLLAARRRLPPPAVPPLALPRAGWFLFRGCLRPAGRFPARPVCSALAARLFGVARWFRLLSAPPLVVCVARCWRPLPVFPYVLSACLPLRSLLFVGGRRRWLLRPPPPSSSPGLCFVGVATLPLVVLCARSAFSLLPVPLPFVAAWCCPPPPPGHVLASVSRVSSPVLLGGLRCCVRYVVWCTVPCCTLSCCPSCVVWCRLVLFCAAVCCVMSLGAVWCRGVWRGALCVAVPCCGIFCCAFGRGVLLHCGVLFVLCLAVPSPSAFLCAVLCLLALCCAPLAASSQERVLWDW